jgi:hypothetical protein
MDETSALVTATPTATLGNGKFETIVGGVFVSSFVSRRSESHAFSTVFRSFAEPRKTPKTAQKREK